MNYMKVQAPLLNTFNGRHSTCTGYMQGPVSLAKFGFREKGAEIQSIFKHFGHFLGRILFGDNFYPHEALFFFLKETFLNADRRSCTSND